MSAVSQGKEGVSIYSQLSVRVRRMTLHTVSCQSGSGGCEKLISADSHGQEVISMSCQLSVRVRRMSAHNVSCQSVS